VLTLFDLFEFYGLNPKKIKLVRHGKEVKGLDILDWFRNEETRQKFEEYQCFQRPGKFSGAETIAAFAPTRGTSSLFLGLWDIKGQYKTYSEFSDTQLASFKDFKTRFDWDESGASWYDLQRNPVMDELSERLVIDWGKGTLQWVQKQNKDILEIKAPNTIHEFLSYDEVCLNFADLRKLVEQSLFNPSWVAALSAVSGVYLVRDKSDGELYVGSAYGNGGIFGRWQDYVRKDGHGGNKGLKGREPKNFEFSILEIASSTASKKEVVARENRWKERLGSRQFGLNGN
jgi:hypothetical protein